MTRSRLESTARVRAAPSEPLVQRNGPNNDMFRRTSDLWHSCRMLVMLGAAFAAPLGFAQTAAAGKMTIERLKERADARDAQAQYELGRRYAGGEGVAVDRERARKLYHDAADQGLAAAEYELARAFGGAFGDQFAPQQAVVYLERAAKHGHVSAQVDLGFAYLNGTATVVKNAGLAFYWFERAAKAGAVPAQCALGDLYRLGRGVPQDDEQAVKWYSRSAVTKDRCAPKAQFELYASYESGKGVRQDLKTATAWLQRAAEAGNPRAQDALGRNYRTGHGVSRNPELARFWLLKSREGAAPHEDEHDENHH